jgi:hypothetical protein
MRTARTCDKASKNDMASRCLMPIPRLSFALSAHNGVTSNSVIFYKIKNLAQKISLSLSLSKLFLIGILLWSNLYEKTTNLLEAGLFQILVNTVLSTGLRVTSFNKLSTIKESEDLAENKPLSSGSHNHLSSFRYVFQRNKSNC